MSDFTTSAPSGSDVTAPAGPTDGPALVVSIPQRAGILDRELLPAGINPHAPARPMIVFPMKLGEYDARLSRTIDTGDELDTDEGTNHIDLLLGPVRLVFPLDGNLRTTLALADEAERISRLCSAIFDRLMGRAGSLPADEVGTGVAP